MKKVFPGNETRSGMVDNGPVLGFGVKGAFVGLAPLVTFQNDLALNDALKTAIDGAPFQPNTQYGMLDHGRVQAAGALHLGWAGAVMRQGDPRKEGSALYTGARLKILRGLGYGEAYNDASFTTSSTLFENPVDVNYVGTLRSADPEGGRLGRGLDLGAVWIVAGTEVGLGLNDIGTRIDWRVRETRVFRDANGDYADSTIADGRRYTSRVPTTAVLNAARKFGPYLVAADLTRGVVTTTGHLGVERWFGNVAARLGGCVDANHQVQFAGGGGVRFGRLGFDLALDTDSRNLARERGVELAAGVTLYH